MRLPCCARQYFLTISSINNIMESYRILKTYLQIRMTFEIIKRIYKEPLQDNIISIYNTIGLYCFVKYFSVKNLFYDDKI